MKRSSVIISVALAATLGLTAFAGQISRRTSQQQAASLVRREVPIGSDRTRVEAWLKARRIQYGFVPKGKFPDYWFTSNTNGLKDAKKLIVGYSPGNPNIEMFFFFDKRDRLINREVM